MCLFIVDFGKTFVRACVSPWGAKFIASWCLKFIGKYMGKKRDYKYRTLRIGVQGREVKQLRRLTEVANAIWDDINFFAERKN